MKKFTFIFAIIALAFACSPDNDFDSGELRLESPNLPSSEFDYVNEVIQQQSRVPVTVLLDANTQLTNAGATLGRVLFYDTKLSETNSIACGSCHLQAAGFADPRPESVGFQNRKTNRNSMSIANVMSFRALFWDGRATNLEEQVIMPIANHVEMGMEDMDLLANKLESVPYYAELFRKAFGSPNVTPDRISQALSQYLQSMVSYNSKFDRAIFMGEENLSELEMEGMEIFNRKFHCGSCHNGSNFSGHGGVSNIGLDEVYTDEGAKIISGIENQSGAFRVPSLRNIAVTAPYMHDGRFSSLEQVLDHYSTGVADHEFLDHRLVGVVMIDPNGGGGGGWSSGGGDIIGIDPTFGPSDPIFIEPGFFPPTGQGSRHLNMTERDKRALVAFLKTLTDTEYLTHPRFSDPFDPKS